MFKTRIHLFDRIALGVITFFIVMIYFTNFAGNFWLTGWDNLHPEFNHSANLERAIFSSWQEYQGLGLPAGHGHAVELTREAFLSVLDLFLPTLEVRKIFSVLMLWVGVVGVYVFIRNILLTKINFELKIIVSFIASSFYLFNLATLQIFYVPYEAFLAQYAFLPWMVYGLFNFMQSPSKKSLFLFLLLNLLGTWQFYIPTLFIVYIFFLSVIALGIVIEYKASWKNFFLVIAGAIIVNLYWLLPFAYYTLNNINSQQDAYLNILYTEDTYLKNAEFGGLKDAVLLRGFLFNTIQFSNTDGFLQMLGPWINHVNTWYVLFIGYGLFIIILTGLFYAIKQRNYLFLCALFFLFFGLLANQTPPFNLLNDVLRSVPLLDQIFRNPFTKFANVTLLLMTVFLSIGLVLVITKLQTSLNKYVPHRYVSLGVLYIVLVGLGVYMLPLWQGRFIYPELKKSIPQEYFQLFDYFKTQKNGRIANLPQFTANGWNYYLWGYQGSGFIWYGLKQPILDRAFDVWNKDNENYYWEISEAIYSENLALFESLLEKYQISWLILDGNVTTTASSKMLFTGELKDMLSHSQKIKRVKQFGNIAVYEVNLLTKPDDFVYLQSKLPNVLPVTQWNNRDQGYIDYGNYKSIEEDSDNEIEVFYPFRSLFTARRQEELEFSISENNDYFIFKKEIPSVFRDIAVTAADFDSNEITEVNKNDFSSTIKKEPVVLKDGTFLEVYVPKINGYFSDTTVLSAKLNELKPNNCNKFNRGSLKLSPVSGKDILLHLESLHSNNCLDFQLPILSQRLSYLVAVPSKHIAGKGLYFTVNNRTTEREEVATYLPKNSNLTTSYFLLPPRQDYGAGYDIHIDNISLDQKETINELGEIRVNPIPYKFLTALKFVKNQEENTNFEVKITPDVSQVGPSFYNVSFYNLENIKYIVLAQSYNAGWKAYVVDGWLSETFPILFGKELKEHIKINNWANGWQLVNVNKQNSSVKIQLIFVPQFLQYFGFLLLPVPFIYAFWPRKRKRV